MARLGVRTVEEMVGRSDFLKQTGSRLPKGKVKGESECDFAEPFCG